MTEYNPDGSTKYKLVLGLGFDNVSFDQASQKFTIAGNNAPSLRSQLAVAGIEAAKGDDNHQLTVSLGAVSGKGIIKTRLLDELNQAAGRQI